MSDFLPQGYEAPKTGSKYLKLKQGSNIIRILESPLLGWLDWTVDKKPVRTPYEGEKSIPKPIDPKRKVKHFWAFPVWDYSDGTVKILEITQSTIQDAIYTLSLDDAWGNPKGYDIDIKKTGEELATEYAVIPKPPKELSAEVKEVVANTKINLHALMSGGDPFATGETTPATPESEPVVNVEDIPW